MIDQDSQNERWLEAAQQNFDEAVSENDWSTARAVIADLRDYGFDHNADILMKALYQAQLAMGNPTEEEDITAGHEDPRDIADRDYPRE